MKKLLLATAATLAFSAAHAQEAKVGIILGYTGPIESLTPAMADAAEMALAEATAAGVLGGVTLTPVRADSTCIDSAAATAAAERVVTADNVSAIVGADCSGVTTAIANNVTIPNGVPMISPSATSPALSTIEDNGFFFRTAPSDARQGEVMTNVLMDRGIKEVAVTFTNNDYGKGLADSFQGFHEAAGGTVTISAAHEDGKGDYSAEVGALASAGGEMLVVAGYLDQGGKGIIQTSLDTGAFDTFLMPDGMIGDSIIEAIGDDLEGSIGTLPGVEGAGADAFAAMVGGNPGPFAAESYDAAALIALAMQKANSTDRAMIQAAILDVANGPGEPILPGELAKGIEILKNGGDVDYVGASAVELIGPGEAAGSYKELEVKGGKFETIQIR